MVLAQAYSCQYVCPPTAASRVMDYGVRGLASPHPFMGATSGRITSWCAVLSEVKVATFIRTCWRTRAVLPSLLAGVAGYDAPRAVFLSFVHVCGVSTGAVLGPGAMAVVVEYGADGQTAHYCVVSTGAVLGQGRSNFLS